MFEQCVCWWTSYQLLSTIFPNVCYIFVKRLCNNLPLYTTSPGLPYTSMVSHQWEKKILIKIATVIICMKVIITNHERFLISTNSEILVEIMKFELAIRNNNYYNASRKVTRKHCRLRHLPVACITIDPYSAWRRLCAR